MIVLALIGTGIVLYLICWSAGSQIVGDDEKWYITVGVGAIMVTVLVALFGCVLYTIHWLGS